eukprot:1871595-Pyramimonas_sp.AAC.1
MLPAAGGLSTGRNCQPESPESAAASCSLRCGDGEVATGNGRCGRLPIYRPGEDGYLSVSK